MMNLLKLSIVLAVMSTAYSQQRLQDDEIEYYFSVKSRDQAPTHEVVLIEHVTNSNTRHVTRDAISEPKITMKFRAFGEDFHLEMEQDTTFVTEGARVRYVDKNGEVYSEPIARDCFYRGTLRNEKKSLVAISACSGVWGSLLRDDAGPLYIEPLKEEHALRRNLGAGLSHVVYQRSVRKQQYCGVKDEIESSLHNDESSTSVENKYLKIHGLADYKVIEQRGDNAQRCMEALFHGVSARLSLLPGLTASVNGITFASKEVFDTTSSSGNNLGLVRDWTNAQPDSSDWDVVAGVTSTYMDNLGLAWVSSACGGNKASITYVGDMQAVEVVSHEIGHNLSMGHDSGGAGCSNSGYVMAAVGTCSKCEMGWTRCSTNSYKSFSRSASCLNDP